MSGALPASLIGHTQALVTEVFQFAWPADVVVSRYFKRFPALGHRDRGVVAEAVYAVLRQRLEFSSLAQSAPGPIDRRLALLGLAFVAGIPAVVERVGEAEAEWLKRLQHIDRHALPFDVRCNLPDWLMTRLKRRFSDAEVEALAAALNTAAPLDLRVNSQKITREECIEILRLSGIAGEATRFSPDGIRIMDKPALNLLPIFKDGSIEVQDEGSQLLAQLVAPKRGELVIDFCAGAGGKTLALGALMRSTGRLYALDVSARRLSHFKPRLARSSLSNVHPMVIDSERDARLKRFVGKADRVLIDAPCSGLGTLRRNPDLKWRQNEVSIAELALRQGDILESAARLVTPGGRLVYATCSLLDEENQAVVAKFLAAHPEFETLDAGEILASRGIEGLPGATLELWPHRQNTDGFFCGSHDALQETRLAQMDDLAALFSSWLAALGQPTVQWQLILIAVLSLVSLFGVRLAKWRLTQNASAADASAQQRSMVQVVRLADVIWPLVAALLLQIAARIEEVRHQQSQLLRMAVLVYFAGGAIRLAVYAVKRVFRPSGMLALLQRALTFITWLVVVLHLAGLLSYLTDALESVGVYQLSSTGEEVNLLQILQATFWVALTLVVALWAGTALEARLLRTSSLDASLQVALGRFGRAVLVVVAVLVSMQVVGIPLGMLSVFGGALGVGVGLGLQRIASNYISGFILLLDRSLRIGDLIAVDKYSGSVSQIRTRYTVIKALDGTEAILPNELLVSSPVLNHSFTSRQSRLFIKLQISFDSDVEQAMKIMAAAAATEPRVLADPAPLAMISGFASDGLDMELGYWVNDPELGTGGVRSGIALQILKGFKQAGIEIPNPKRDIRLENVTFPSVADK